MILFCLAATEPSLAESPVARTEERLCGDAAPLWVSNGLDAYGAALFQRHHVIETYPRTGKRGRPRRLKVAACPTLRYGQVVKRRNEKRCVVGVIKRAIFEDVPLQGIQMVCMVCIERHNLNLRHENRRLTRKTIAFSKKPVWLERQMHLYQAYCNWVRPHRGLAQRIISPGFHRWLRRTPAIAAGLKDHIWTLRELMSNKFIIFSTRNNLITY
ncbi:MAG: hypothetical protein JRI22_12385 [Deltaproteobacteria bacterium]|nr:hypothetical protein [Deltaproteobacteria bacterium]